VLGDFGLEPAAGFRVVLGEEEGEGEEGFGEKG